MSVTKPSWTSLTSSFSRYLLGAVVGGLLLYNCADLEPISFPEVIVPAARIIAAEPPPPKIIEKIRYIYLQPDIRAVAPLGDTPTAAEFCRPQVVADAEPKVSLIRTFTHKPALFPLQKDRLQISSMNGIGDIFLEDYSVRPGFRASYENGVSYPRLALVKEAARGLGWYAIYRGLELVIR